MEDQICELCGSKTNKLFLIKIEGSILRVCASCKSLGKEIKEKPQNKNKNTIKKVEENEEVEDIIEEYGKIIEKEIIDKFNSIENFCKKFSISPNYIKKIIKEELKPTLEEAKRLEKILHTKLITKEKIKMEEWDENKKNNPASLKLAMFIKDEKLKKMLERKE